MPDDDWWGYDGLGYDDPIPGMDEFSEDYPGGGSAGDDPNFEMPSWGDTGGFDWGGLLSSGGDALGSFLKSLGLVNKAGGIDLGSLLALGGTVYGGTKASDAAKAGSAQMQEAASKANDEIRSILGQTGAALGPYSDAGKAALAKMAAFDAAPLAAQFKATGGGVPVKLATGGPAYANTLGEVARLIGRK